MLVFGAPTRVAEDLDERREDCAHYQACLRYAINKNWDGFSCESCSDFQASTMEMMQAAEEIGVSLANARRG